MNKQDYVRWTGEDTQGKFSYFAQVIQLGLKDNFVELLIPGVGTMFVQETDGAFKVINKPKNFDQLNQHMAPSSTNKDDRVFSEESTKATPIVQKQTVIKQPTIVSERVSTDGVGNKQRAIDLYTTMIVDGVHPSRGDVIEAFVTKLGFKSTTASTYQSNCKREWCK